MEPLIKNQIPRKRKEKLKASSVKLKKAYSKLKVKETGDLRKRAEGFTGFLLIIRSALKKLILMLFIA
jgi:hypothetical protein